MSVEKKHSAVLDEDNEDTERIIDEKDPTKESTGPKADYQHVVDPQTGQKTGKVITSDGRVMTAQPIVPSRPVLPGLANPGGGFSISIGDVNIPKPLINITEPLINVTKPFIDIDLPEFSIPEKVINVEIDIPEPLINIELPEFSIPEKAVNIELKADIPEKAVNIEISADIPEKAVNIELSADIPPGAVAVDIDASVEGPLVPPFPEIPPFPEKLVDLSITEPLIKIPPFPEWPQFPEIPEDLVHIEGPLIEIPPIPEWPEFPEIPENLVNIVGPMIEMPEIPEEGLINVGDIRMPDVVGGIDVDMPEIPEPVAWAVGGGIALLGVAALILSIAKFAKPFSKPIGGLLK